MRNFLLAVSMMAMTGPALAIDETRVQLDDPFKTGVWNYHQKQILGDPAKIKFDKRVIVSAPTVAEDSFNVPVLVDATAIDDVKRIVLFVDYGPIPKILTYYPENAQPKLAFRFKIDQSTPVRAAVETHSGTWHVGHTHVDATGGGCTAPALAYAASDWPERLGEVNGSVWPERGRLRMIVDHPMDTGLADGIPVFIIKTLQVDDMAGKKMARIELHEPVNEDPAFTLFFGDGKLSEKVRVHGRDNNGNEINAVLGSLKTQ